MGYEGLHDTDPTRRASDARLHVRLRRDQAPCATPPALADGGQPVNDEDPRPADQGRRRRSTSPPTTSSWCGSTAPLQVARRPGDSRPAARRGSRPSCWPPPWSRRPAPGTASGRSRTRRAARQPADHFFKNVSMLGGLLIAAVDTEGKPGLAWRAKNAAEHRQARGQAPAARGQGAGQAGRQERDVLSPPGAAIPSGAMNDTAHPGRDLWPAPHPDRPVDAVVRLPGSKSLTNRALVLAALSDGPSVVRHALRSRDTVLMADALTELGRGRRHHRRRLEGLPGAAAGRRHRRLRARRHGDAVRAAGRGAGRRPGGLRR